MKDRMMVDLNVLLDVLENRREWVADSARVCALCADGRAEGFIPAHAVTTIYYIVRKRGGKALAGVATDWLLANFKVAKCTAAEFRAARKSGIDDFEDAVVAASAKAEKCACIVTRNIAHFASSPVPAITPSVCLSRK